MKTQEQEPFLLRDPSVSRTHIAFSYGGCIWVTNHKGEELRRLTTVGRESKPAISPDGTNIAFIGEYEGPRGVFVMPLAGGEPRRLTFHPADLSLLRMLPLGDTVGWTPDGARVLFSSRRGCSVGAWSSGVRLFTVSVEGGPANSVPLARAVQGSLSPDEQRIAYVPHIQGQLECKRYRGGQARFIAIAELADSSIVARIPRDGSNDFNPIWIGETIYFLSDRNGPVTLFAYELKSRHVRQVVQNDGLDIKAASAVADTVVYEQFGSLHCLDLKSGRDRKLDIRPVGDFPEVRSRFENAAECGLTEGPKVMPRLSPSGARAVLGLRGRIVTIPAKKGDIRVLTQCSGVSERDPAWSPDGRSIAYFSDESGEYALHVRDASGRDVVRKINLGHSPAFYHSPVWSPDSKKIAYGDQRLNYWYVDLGDSTPVRFDTSTFVDTLRGDGGLDIQMAWSPDSRWIAYVKQLPSHLRAVFVHSVEKGESNQLTDGMSDACDVAFDRGGQYLYFTASTDIAMSGDWLDMNSYRRPVTRSVYAFLLGRDSLTPLPIESDEEKNQGLTTSLQQNQATESVPAVQICLEDIGQRIVRLPLPPRNYYGLWAGRSGVIFVTEGPQVEESNIYFSLSGYPKQKVHRFDINTLRSEQILDGAVYFELSFDGRKMLYARQHDKRQWFITETESVADPTEGLLRTDHIEIFVDPRLEWKQMYEEAWRQKRDFFYDPGLHGLSLEKVKKTYEPFLTHIVSSEELQYLFNEMMANLTCLHMATQLATPAETRRFTIGLLGADYSVENGRYRFLRIYDSDPWSAESRSPLREPGRIVHAGEYLLAVNGSPVRASSDVYSYFAGTVGKQTVIEVGPKSDGSGSREVKVVPIEDEYPLRHFAWVEGNRRRVDELTDGRVAYIYLPNLRLPGYAAFNRQFFAQVGKDAVIVDDRYNSGGHGADYIIECLRRPLLNYWHLRQGKDLTGPLLGIFGPKVMLINEMSSSMGERLPWTFRELGLGPLVGTRTWGGLVGFAKKAPDLVDGGYVMTPNLAFYSPRGTWEIENQGVSPDIEVEDDPKAARAGRDPQLERAVEVVMDLLKQKPSPSLAPQHPPYPNYHGET